MNKTLCFRQTRRVHDSGYRYIEYGYMIENNDEESVDIIGRYDLLQFPRFQLDARIDLTKSGWFRILPWGKTKLEWGYGGEIIEAEKTMTTTIHQEKETV